MSTMNDPVLQLPIDLNDCRNAIELDGVRYRRLNPLTDLGAVCQLFETVFHQPMTQAHWQWKYLQGPGAGSFSIVAEDMTTQKMIGHMGALVLPGMRDGGALRMGQVCDVMLHPEYRAGIGPKSTYFCMNQAMRQLAHSPQQSALVPLYMYGFPGKRPANLGERIGVYRRLQVCTEYMTETDLRESHWLQKIWRRVKPGQLRVQPMDESEFLQRSALLDDIWQRYSQAIEKNKGLSQTPRLIKNAAYLRWRYWMNPSQLQQKGNPPYAMWLLLKGRFPVGWFVTRLQPCPTVVDSCLLPGWNEAALRALPRPSCGDGQDQGSWVSWLAQSHMPSKLTPIHAVEVLGQPFHPDWPCPAFQPGDTDVF